MATVKIKPVVDAMPIKDLTPTPPTPPAPVEFDPDVEEAALGDVITWLVHPWIYGDNLNRFATQSGLTIKEVQKIKEVVDARIAVETAEAQVMEL